MIDKTAAEAISAYLDGQLGPRERERLETRLQQDPALRGELESLRRTRELLHSAPRYRAPRNFTLTPEMAGAPAEKPGFAFSISRLAFTLSALLFVVALAGNVTFQALPGGQPEEPTAFSLEAAPEMESLDQSAAPADGDAAGAAEAESMPAAELQVESVESGEDPEAPDSFDPTSQGSSAVAEEAADAQPVEDPIVEGTVTVESGDGLPAAAETVAPEIAAAPADSSRSMAEPAQVEPAPRAARINPWSIFVVLTGLAAALSGGLALALRRR